MFTLILTKYDGAILGPIAAVLGWIMDLIYNVLSTIGIENAGLCLVVFTFLVNGLMIPLNIKQQKFTKLSSIMNPELMKINEKYKGRKDEDSLRKQQLETQAVYDKYGASPTAGCLPMLLSMLVMFALYRVVYDIPAYVTGIRDIYGEIAAAIQGTDYLTVMTEFAGKFPTLNVSKWGDITKSIPVSNLIDIMAQFRSSDWVDLVNTPEFASIKDVIQTNADRIMQINTIGFGVNIAEAPWGQIAGSNGMIQKVFYAAIPVLSVVTQMIQTKFAMRNQPPMDEKSTAAATMKSMNTFMPFMSGFFCLTLPVGVGIYWIAGSVFRIFQQMIIDHHMGKVDVDDLIQKNRDKQRKKKERLGIDPNKSAEDIAKLRTSSIQGAAKTSGKSSVGDVAKGYHNAASSKSKGSVSESKSSTTGKTSQNSKFKSGSIADYANMLARDRKEREGK